MTDDEIGRLIVDRLMDLSMPLKSVARVFDELSEVNARVRADATLAPTPAGASEAFDWCMKGAECYFRLAIVFALAEDRLYELESRERNEGE